MISIISIAYNHSDFTEMLLSSLLHPGCADADYELVFIDNGSSDNTQELVTRFDFSKNPHFQRLQFHRFEENRGVAAAINAGVDLSEGPWILQADNDVVFGPGSVSTLLDWVTRHPRSLVSPNWPWVQRKLGEHFFKAAGGLTPAALDRLARVGRKAPLEKERATGSCWMCAKELFVEIGGWDDEFRNACASDDFIWKAAVAGAKRFTVPCPVFHAGKVTRGALPQNVEQETKDLVRFHGRWGSHPQDRRHLELTIAKLRERGWKVPQDERG